MLLCVLKYFLIYYNVGIPLLLLLMYLRTEGLFLGVIKSRDVSRAAESLASILGSALGSLDDDSGFHDVEFVMILNNGF